MAKPDRRDRLLKSLNRHVFRPAHLHMMFIADGYEPLTTALYFKGDPYLVCFGTLTDAL